MGYSFAAGCIDGAGFFDFTQGKFQNRCIYCQITWVCVAFNFSNFARVCNSQNEIPANWMTLYLFDTWTRIWYSRKTQNKVSAKFKSFTVFIMNRKLEGCTNANICEIWRVTCSKCSWPCWFSRTIMYGEFLLFLSFEGFFFRFFG